MLQPKIDQANPRSGEAFIHEVSNRSPEDFLKCREDWEAATPELMELFARVSCSCMFMSSALHSTKRWDLVDTQTHCGFPCINKPVNLLILGKF